MRLFEEIELWMFLSVTYRQPVTVMAQIYVTVEVTYS